MANIANNSSVNLNYITFASIITLISGTLFYFWQRKKYKLNFVPNGKVKKLLIYPVKALRGVEVESLEITNNVVKYGHFRDRSLTFNH